MFRHHMHTSKTIRVTGGMFKSVCSCGWESMDWGTSRFAEEALEAHKKQAMAVQEKHETWDTWLKQHSDVLTEADRDEDQAIHAYEKARSHE